MRLVRGGGVYQYIVSVYADGIDSVAVAPACYKNGLRCGRESGMGEIRYLFHHHGIVPEMELISRTHCFGYPKPPKKNQIKVEAATRIPHPHTHQKKITGLSVVAAIFIAA